MALFGNNSNGGSGGLLAALTGGGQQAPSPTAAVAEETGATAGSPFLQYLQANQGAAKQTAEALMGPRPEPDYTMPLIQAGLGILGAPTGGSPLQAIAQGASQALPAFAAERNRGRAYDEKAQALAQQLGLKDFEVATSGNNMQDDLVEKGGNVISKSLYARFIAGGADPMTAYNKSIVKKGTNEGKGDLVERGGAVISQSRYDQILAETGDPTQAFNESIVQYKKTSKQADVEALRRKREQLEILKMNGSADPRQLENMQEEIRMYEQALYGAPDKITVTRMDGDGNFITSYGTAEEIAQMDNVIAQGDEAAALRDQQEALTTTLRVGERLIRTVQKADIMSSGQLGGIAGGGAAWGKAINEMLGSERRQQFEEEVGEDPMRFFERLQNDPEADGLLGQKTINTLSKLGQDRADILSNVIALGYATARASDPGGRLSNADVAMALQQFGFNMDALLNDPAAIVSATEEQLSRNVGQYVTALNLRENSDEIIKKDAVLNKFIPELNFEYSGGINGNLRYTGQRRKDSGSGQQQQQTPAAAPQGQQQQSTPAPQSTPGQRTAEDFYNAY